MDGYIVVAYESTTLYDDFNKNSEIDRSSEFFALLSLYPEMFPSGNVNKTLELKLVHGIIDHISIEYKSFEIDGKKIDISLNYDEYSNTETIEYISFQVQINGRFASY